MRLEASKMVDTDHGVKIVWENGFNKTHVVEVIFYNNGFVMGLAFDIEKVGWDKRWTVTELSVPYSSDAIPLPLQLTIDESLEYIRHFIWANHTI